jgi:hypothetical protein
MWMYWSIIKQRAWGVRGWESYGEWGQYSPTLFRIQRTAVRIGASVAQPRLPSVIWVIVVGHS